MGRSNVTHQTKIIMLPSLSTSHRSTSPYLIHKRILFFLMGCCFWLSVGFVQRIVTSLSFPETAFPHSILLREALDGEALTGNNRTVTIVVPTSSSNIMKFLSTPTMTELVHLSEVDRVVVIWPKGNSSECAMLKAQVDVALLEVKDKVFFEYPSLPSPHHAYFPWPSIATVCTLHLTDLTHLTRQAFHVGYQWWRLNEHRVVGFYPRVVGLGEKPKVDIDESSDSIIERINNEASFEQEVSHLPTEENVTKINYFKNDKNHLYGFQGTAGQSYNYVLSSVAFLHLGYLYDYTHFIPDKYTNHVTHTAPHCADLLMHFTVPAILHPPLLVAPISEVRQNVQQEDNIHITDSTHTHLTHTHLTHTHLTHTHLTHTHLTHTHLANTRALLTNDPPSPPSKPAERLAHETDVSELLSCLDIFKTIQFDWPFIMVKACVSGIPAIT
eukprot:GHVN01031747.1.p1 GENE.GHVN01031747.1~~GHVN01031747.1.p1  ORF type:complete len:442 (+),score=91.08 GHVN01031747.1:140-1465(+)